jgi:hypothetical protein
VAAMLQTNDRQPDESEYTAHIKQHLRIKAFYGCSENPVKTQIWIAVASYVSKGTFHKNAIVPDRACHLQIIWRKKLHAILTASVSSPVFPSPTH